jgi:hypothetical protein
MGTITRSFANNITTSGVLLPASLTNNSIANVTAYNASVATGNMVLLSSQTASNSASISFTTGINSTYKEYQFYFINCRPSSDSNTFQFQGSINGGTNYNTAITSTFFKAMHNEADTSTTLEYVANSDLAQGTGFQCINELNDLGFDADQSISGTLTLFNPASTTYVKHFISTTNYCHQGDYTVNGFMAGYFNTTSAINAIQFKMATNNITDGTILMYGIV